LKQFNPNKEDFDKRLNILKDLFKNKEVNNDDLQKIVKYYLYILENRTDLNEYKLCNINNLLENFKIIIGNTFNFFEIKKQNDAINFISFCYNQILELFNIIKIKVYKNSSEFDKINKEEIINIIQDESNTFKKKIKKLFREKRTEITKKIEDCQDDQEQFKSLFGYIKGNCDSMITYINEDCQNFDKFLKKTYDNYINKLNLEEMEKSKKEFEENMKNFNNVRLDGISQDSSDYISFDYKILFFF
jgi:hypothetical protein